MHSLVARSIPAEEIHSNRHNAPGAIEAFIVLSRSAQVPARLRVLVFVLGELFRDIFAWRCGYAAEASVEFDGRACFWLN